MGRKKSPQASARGLFSSSPASRFASSGGYLAAVERVALFPNGLGRRVVAVSGDAAVRVVNGLASNDVRRVIDARTGAYTFFLDRRARIVADLRALPAPAALPLDDVRLPGDAPQQPPDAPQQTLWLDVPDPALAGLIQHLRKYVPPIFATHRLTDIRVVTVIGPEAEKVVRMQVASDGADTVHMALGDAVQTAPADASQMAPLEVAAMRLGDNLGLMVRREEVEGPGCDFYFEPGPAARLVRQLQESVTECGGDIATPEDWNILRVERGLPLFGSELGPERLAPEAGQNARAISLEKGCFTGQEIVARIHYRGHVNRRLRALHCDAKPTSPLEDPGQLSGSALRLAPNSRAELKSSDSPGKQHSRHGSPVGVVTSAVLSPRFGPVALAYVRREVETGQIVRPEAAPDLHFRVAALPSPGQE